MPATQLALRSLRKNSEEKISTQRARRVQWKTKPFDKAQGRKERKVKSEAKHTRNNVYFAGKGT